MNNNEKMFEEQIREIAECNKKDCKDCVGCAYYCAITRFCEDKIVLTKEEFNDLEYKAYARGVNSFNELHEKQLEKTKGKTALHFAELLKENIKNHRTEMYLNGLKGTPRTKELTYECVEEYIDETAKEIIEGE